MSSFKKGSIVGAIRVAICSLSSKYFDCNEVGNFPGDIFITDVSRYIGIKGILYRLYRS